MNYKNGLTAGLLALGLGACFIAPKRLDNIPLAWRPTSEIALPTGTDPRVRTTKVQFEVFKDVRKQPELIAENREDATTPKQVTTKENVGSFASEHVRTIFDRMGLTTVDNGGDVVLSGEVRQFFVDETNTYKGRVQLHLTLSSKGGKALWNGTVTGEASRFGRSYSAENYYEEFSDSLIKATAALLEDLDFQAALIRKE